MFRMSGTHQRPTVVIDIEKGFFEISGSSIPENPMEVFTPIFDNLNTYLDNPKETTELNFRLDYFNTSTSKLMLDMIHKLEVLTEKDGLLIEYEATTDKATPINLTNHTYFNLSGAGAGNILDHLLTIHASKATERGEDGIPTGETPGMSDWHHPSNGNCRKVSRQSPSSGPVRNCTRWASSMCNRTTARSPTSSRCRHR